MSWSKTSWNLGTEDPVDDIPKHNGAPADRNKREPETPGRQDSSEREALEARSAEVQQIIGRPPHWLVRGGIGVFLGVLLLVFGAASAIEYPEIVQASVTLRFTGGPLVVEASGEGRLQDLPLENGATVEQGQLLAVLGREGAAGDRIVAPAGGTLLYAGVLEAGQPVKAGQTLFQIRPEGATYYGELTIPESSFGKVEEGQTVLVRFNGYPSQEYGSVKAQIDYFPEVLAREGAFEAKVSFPGGLTTNYGRQITPVDGMIGQAEIITKDRKLLERIYENLTSQLR